MAIDLSAWLRVEVCLFEDHFEIPRYEGFMERVTEKRVKKYRKLLDKYLGKYKENSKEKTLEM